MNENIMMKQLVSSAWSDFKKNSVAWLLSMCLYAPLLYLIMYVAQLPTLAPEYNFITPWALSKVIALIATAFGIILIKNGLNTVYNRELNWTSISAAILKATLVNFMIGLPTEFFALYVGELLLTYTSSYAWSVIIWFSIIIYISVMYVSIRCMFCDTFLLEQNCTIMQAYSRSWNLTRNQIYTLLSLCLVSGLLMIAGVLALGFGVFVALPMMILMKARLFKNLTSLSSQE